MEIINITKELDNPLFNRKEIELELASEITPSRLEVQEALSKKFSTLKDTIRVKQILGQFGSKTFKIVASIYTSKKDLEETESFSKKEKDAMKKAEEEAKKTAESKKK